MEAIEVPRSCKEFCRRPVRGRQKCEKPLIELMRMELFDLILLLLLNRQEVSSLAGKVLFYEMPRRF